MLYCFRMITAKYYDLERKIMKISDINIRDPFVLNDRGKYYLYGTRAANFGKSTGGFDVYVSDDLESWSEPIPCFDSIKYGLNRDANWAPEVHKFCDKYYMLATFTGDDGLRGTYILVADDPIGPFAPHSFGHVTPDGWECLDGTLYVESGIPYLVFCHEHTQIIDGTVEYLRLSKDLKRAQTSPVTIFKGSSPEGADKKPSGEHYITDGPFMYTTSNGELLMVWSTFIKGKYAQCVAKSQNGTIGGGFIHLPPLMVDDGGHGMIFRSNERLLLTYHSPNKTGSERPHFVELSDHGDGISIC